MTITICIVNGIKLQNPSPKNLTRSAMELPAASPATKTTSTASNANTNASGNHRSDQSAITEPRPAQGVAELSAAVPDSSRGGFVAGIGVFQHLRFAIDPQSKAPYI